MRGTVEVRLWGTVIGYLGYPPGESRYAVFEYEPSFMESGIQVSPVHLSYPPGRYAFDRLNYNAFMGLPGFIADSLPDRYGNQLIDIYMAEKNIPSAQVTALDRLNYVADRGMGALEYRPGESLPLQRTALDLQDLTVLAELVLKKKEELRNKLLSARDRASALTMIRVGSSAGGARSKALVALSPKGTVLDGTVNHGPGYTYWVLKFDNAGNRDRDVSDPKGMPVLEYIYSLIAARAGITMPRTDLIGDGKDRHFLIERFDRLERAGKLDKLHYSSWAGLAHADRDEVNSYEQLILLNRQLKLGQGADREIFRRAVFNVIGRNQDDHTKNTGYLMDRRGQWKISPAFDLTYSYDPAGRWTRTHQCYLNKKNDSFTRNDLEQFGRYCNLKESQIREIIEQTGEAFSHFPSLAKEWELPEGIEKTVESNLRLGILKE